jgi:hypothetical protein
MAQHYMAIVTPRAEGGWHAILPDFPGISADAARIDAAKNELARMVADAKIEAALFQPMTLADFRASKGNDFDWRGAVICMMPLPIPDMRQQSEDLISLPVSCRRSA